MLKQGCLFYLAILIAIPAFSSEVKNVSEEPTTPISQSALESGSVVENNAFVEPSEPPQEEFFTEEFQQTDRTDSKKHAENLYLEGMEAYRQNYGARAIRKWKRAAKLNYIPALLKLGDVFAAGDLVTKNYETAFQWYQKAADLNDPVGQYKIAMMYLRGEGVRKSREEAAKWLRQSAEQGYAKAQTNYGTLFIAGWGVQQDFLEAVRWFTEAADQNYGDAQYLLGVAYEHGEGVIRDIEIAKSWYQKAAANGCSLAHEPLFRLGGYK